MSSLDKTFIRALTTAVVESSLQKNQKTLTERQLKAGMILLQKYIDNNDALEVQCLFAIQALIVKLEHPYGKYYLGRRHEVSWGAVAHFVMLAASSLFLHRACRTAAQDPGRALR